MSITGADYEPPEQQATTLRARREFLLTIADIESKVVSDLFSLCFRTFLRLTHYSLDLGNEKNSIAEVLTFDMLLDECGHTKLWVDPITGNFHVIPLVDRYLDAKAFRQCLIDWGAQHGLTEDWCYEFGRQVLLYYWRNRRDWKPFKARMLAASASEPKPVQSRPVLPLPTLGPSASHLAANRLGNLEAAPLPSPLGPPASRAKQPPRLSNLPKPLLHSKDDPIKENNKDATEISESTQESASPNETEGKYYEIAVMAAGLAIGRHFDSWREVADRLIDEARIQLTVPEERFENKYEQPAGWLFGGTFRLKPDYLRPQPPKPPDGFPPRALPPFYKLDSREEYERRVKFQIKLDLCLGNSHYLSNTQREKIMEMIFENRKGEFKRYCDEYDHYLKGQGWVKTPNKKEFKLHCEWLVRYAVCGWKIDQIVNKYGGKVSNPNISSRIHEAARLIGLALPDRRGKK